MFDEIPEILKDFTDVEQFRNLPEDEKEKIVGRLFNQTFKLYGEVNRFTGMKYTSMMIDDPNDHIVMFIGYRVSDSCPEVNYRGFEYHFYIVENHGEYYLQTFDSRFLDSYAAKCGEKMFDNCSCCDSGRIGLITSEYREYVRTTHARKRKHLDKSEFESELNRIEKFDIVSSYIDQVYYAYVTVSMEVLDFKNHQTFATDDYYVRDYSSVVKFSEYIFRKSGIPGLANNLLKCVDKITDAWKLCIERHIEKTIEEYTAYYD